MARRAIQLAFLASAAAVAVAGCAFDTAGGRASPGGGDPGDADAGPGGDRDAGGPATPDGAPGIDADPGGEVLIETVTVPVDGSTVESNEVLLTAMTYRLVASGTVVVATTGGGFTADAEYYWQDSNPSSVFDGQSGDPSIDVGLAVDDTTVDGTKTPDWGLPTASHVYETIWPGETAAITFQFHDRNFDNNSGSLTVEIHQQPAL